MNQWLLGFDVGGTKCAAILGCVDENTVKIVRRTAFPTPPHAPELAIAEFERIARTMLAESGCHPTAVGISCGGPLDSCRGVILAPPNLPSWDNVAVTERLSAAFGVPARLQNDANACAYAEWKWGAGKGTKHMVFLTFGTGMGAGLIIDGHLYCGANDMAGEIGHVRLAADGPVGYGKAGSFEGFCSGAGMVRLARQHGMGVSEAQQIFQAADRGDVVAAQVVTITAQYLGRGLAILVDILNPERIIIGSIFARQHKQLWPIAESVLRTESLDRSMAVCRVLPAALGEQIGDFAALAVACEMLDKPSIATA